ncbi:MAG: serine/threonine-protein kinase [Planctomycetota bacterium]
MNRQERHARVFELFDEVCDLEPAAAAERLRVRCGDDDDLRREVESMLAHDGDTQPWIEAGESGRALDALAAELLGDETDDDLPASIGGYRILRRLGQGGMGIIYEAHQESPARRVALKVMRPGMVRAELVKRFHREAHVLGQLQHPGIAQIHASGVSDLPGRPPFLVMELIDGVSLTAHADRQRLDIGQRLELMVRVCDAVQHAHQKGVIHRDLKPSNVLVVSAAIGSATAAASKTQAMVDPIGQPKVLDFGIARMIEQDAALATLQTETGQIIGTLAYMSPEQLANAADALDTRADVYSLGVMAYELLCGELPLDVRGKSVSEAARIIRDDEPTRLGTRKRSLRGDVETIVAKAIDKDRNRRYSTAAELAADLRRWLVDLPIEARPASAVYQIGKFARRNRGLVAGVAVAFAALAIALVMTGLSLAQARTDRDSARSAQALAERIAGFQRSVLRDIDVSAMGETLREQLELEMQPARDRLLQSGELSAAAYADLLQAVNTTNMARKAVDGAVLEQAAAAAASEFADDPATHARMLDAFAQCYQTLALPERALELARLSLDLRRGHLADYDPELARSCGDVGAVLVGMGRASEALPLLEEALRRRQADPNVEPELVLEAQLRLGNAWSLSGERTRAEAMFERTIAAYRARGADDFMLYETLNALAMLYMATERAAEAIPLLEESVAGRRRTMGENNPRTLSTLNNLARAHARLGQLDEAVRRYLELIPILEAAVGDDDARTLLVLGNLTDVYVQRHDLPAARRTLQTILTRQQRSLGDGHPATQRTEARLAALPQ